MLIHIIRLLRLKQLVSQCRLILIVLLVACSSVPQKPHGIANACDILSTDDSWREAFDQTYKKYGVPPHVVMAIIYQESRFVADARPPRKRFFGIPTSRPSSAYGFAQALDETWNGYRNKTGNSGADRDNLVDSVDFIGWYIKANHKRTGVSKWDARDQYLAYHEGSGGYLKRSHNNKPWLLAVANKVDRRARVYRRQLKQCYTFPK
ncbi:MAG: transglycosylase SLT domain-containing protein [Ostreibacterium sp.]